MGKIGIIGGTALNHIEFLHDKREILLQELRNEFGYPSGPITTGNHARHPVYVIPRHGDNRQYIPDEVPHRANLRAFQLLGVERVFGPSAVGALDGRYEPGDIVIPKSFFYFARHRPSTFYNRDGFGGFCCIPMHEPYCPYLRDLLMEGLEHLGYRYHDGAGTAVIAGPQYSSVLESTFFAKLAGCDTIGMNRCPEVQLADEALMCYGPLDIVTDMDTIVRGCEVDAEKVETEAGKATERLNALFEYVLERMSDERNCHCPRRLEKAFHSGQPAPRDKIVDLEDWKYKLNLRH